MYFKNIYISKSKQIENVSLPLSFLGKLKCIMQAGEKHKFTSTNFCPQII